jgi:mannose-1-phosphate guanylyltransferase/mannose-1-phosphate guanylyltransferase/mannose-6-phosphate isomerase
MTQPLITPVILSGGAGTRLWPLSLPERPKQLHALSGTSTMLQMTAARVRDSALFTAPVVIASTRHAEPIAAQLAAISVEPLATILEPVGRNTAAAVALAALEGDPDALLLIMPSDHVIGRPDRFLAAVAAGAVQAEQGYLVTFGITPTRAETGYGYILRGAPLGAGAWAVDRFVEKPDRERAEQYLAGGQHDWNGGIFLFRARDMLAGLEVHAPDILAAVRAALAKGRRDLGAVQPDAASFAAVRSQSIDHALLERHERVAVVPVDMDWSDVGSWDALHDIAAKDADGNSRSGEVLAQDSRNCLFHSTGPRIVAAGLEDLIVVATADAVLILPRGQSQRVKELVDRVAPPPARPLSASE